ncbi:uncharacterized protein PV06_11294 [Exophiala oligosperma]|uniref:Uncharacterized protein n=1 Tax=Exophiala oligosperma TaxID=215243 RepID=A0A0D2DLA4_9EURO|nr:uncharacterized protein PV06_11294 [Exophiala oligosperma]KIW36479.1 hypothetical protein PV06_11294 [Exophiala oligosperma]
MRKKRVDRGSVPFDRDPVQITNVLLPQSSTESETMQRPEIKRLSTSLASTMSMYKTTVTGSSLGSFDLDLVYEDHNPTFLIEQGEVEEGIARRFVKDSPLWVKLCKQNEIEADSILDFSRGSMHLQ